jgi:hypothetical protein
MDATETFPESIARWAAQQRATQDFLSFPNWGVINRRPDKEIVVRDYIDRTAAKIDPQAAKLAAYWPPLSICRFRAAFHGSGCE